ncbi:MAG: biotin attachment protein [Desulfovibrionaceae bacterium]|nr:biotin attachment protein [Desulfovibrionaceae bacterium]
MIDVTALLEKIKEHPYEEEAVLAPHTGVVTFGAAGVGDKVYGERGTFREIPGTVLATLERERNPHPIRAAQNGTVVSLKTDLNGKFVEEGTVLATVRHFLSREEVSQRLLRKTLYLFSAPERAKYYFVPQVDIKVKNLGCRTISVYDGMELFIISRMKREMPLFYHGPEGVIYAVYMKNNANVDAGEPLIGVCPPEQVAQIEEVLLQVQTEWREQD